MQQQPPVMAMVPPFPPTNITTEQIQKYLDENKKLILAILDNQNLGKLAECAQYQALLQKNLMYLAAIADAQPPAPTVPTQMPAHPSMQQGGHYMQSPQAAAMAQQSGVFAQKIPMQFNPQQLQDQQQQQQQHQHQHQQQQQQQQQQQHQQQQHQQQQQQLHHQQQQAMHSHMAMRPGANNGMHVMHSEASLGGGSSGGPPSSTAGLTEFSRGSGTGASSNSVDARGNKQEVLEAGSNDGQGENSAAGHGSANGEQPSFLKGSAADAN